MNKFGYRGNATLSVSPQARQNPPPPADYPGLLTGKHLYKPDDFQVERVWVFFHSCVFTRKVSSAGVLTHFNQRVSIGFPYKSQWAQVRLAANGQSWEVLVKDKVVKTYAATCLSKERIESLSVYQRTNSSKQT